MNRASEPVVILLVEDDAEDVYITRRAFREGKFLNDFHDVQDGDQLFQYLQNLGAYSDEGEHPRPHVILLDVNLPRKNGFEILAELRADELYKAIPVVFLTTSSGESEIFDGYGGGANSFITKPVTPGGMLEVARHFENYWFQLVCIPNRPTGSL